MLLRGLADLGSSSHSTPVLGSKSRGTNRAASWFLGPARQFLSQPLHCVLRDERYNISPTTERRIIPMAEFCTNCGAQLSGAFCGRCGHRAQSATVPAQPSAPTLHPVVAPPAQPAASVQQPVATAQPTAQPGHAAGYSADRRPTTAAHDLQPLSLPRSRQSLQAPAKLC